GLRARLRRPWCGPLASGRPDRARPAPRLRQRPAGPAHGEQAPGAVAAGPAARRDAGPRRTGAAARRRSGQRRIAPGPAGVADPPVAASPLARRCRVASGVVTEAGITRRFNVRIPVRDGITLSADLALPET